MTKEALRAAAREVIMLVLAGILAAQVAAGFGVLWVLKILLDRMLVDLALRYLEALRVCDGVKGGITVVMTTRKPLRKEKKARAAGAVQRNLSSAAGVEFCVDRGIWGGAVVRAGDHRQDFSLKGRLVRAFQTR